MPRGEYSKHEIDAKFKGLSDLLSAMQNDISEFHKRDAEFKEKDAKFKKEIAPMLGIFNDAISTKKVAKYIFAFFMAIVGAIIAIKQLTQ